MWWKERVVYQIYPRSFQDSNGDGIGDIPGIISRLDALKDLGVGVIWLSPVYQSPDADNGYDISDYYSISPKFGTMADMERLFAEAARRDIKVILDLVINHTSDEHEWFRKSRAGDPAYRDYYIWRPAKDNPGGPAKSKKGLPNNWVSFFQGTVWEYAPERGEYYLHLFDRKQPDLNYHNSKVLEEVKNILRFWLDKGAAGFRCDVINILYKTSLEDGTKGPLKGMEWYKTQEGNHQILRELRAEVLDKYDCFTVGETFMPSLAEAKDLCAPSRRELDMIFLFDHLEVDRLIVKYIPIPFSAKKLLGRLAVWQRNLDWNSVVLENHDQPRIVSHYGDDGPYRERSAKLLGLLEFTLRGTPYIYQGQEIGMTNFDFTSLDQLDDVESRNMHALMRGLHIPEPLAWYWLRTASRDNARTPMQWSAAEGAGFTTAGVRPWLGINGNHSRINWEAQKDEPASILSWYRTLIRLRAESETLKYGAFVPLYGDRRVIAYRREPAGGDSAYTVALNISGKAAKFPKIPGLQGTIALSNTGRTAGDWKALGGRLDPWEGVLIRENAR